MRKLAILYGGPGGEHEVSVKSAENILNNIDRSKYELKSFFLPKKTKVLSKKIINELKGFLVWPIFHGEFGEGGYVQSVLEKNKIKHIGSSSKVSALTIDKYKTQKLLEKHGVSCPKSFVIKKISDLGKIKVNYPIIVKPINGGSSVDLIKVNSLPEINS
jgi:D-alanine-D-alanine ligase